MDARGGDARRGRPRRDRRAHVALAFAGAAAFAALVAWRGGAATRAAPWIVLAAAVAIVVALRTGAAGAAAPWLGIAVAVALAMLVLPFCWRRLEGAVGMRRER